MQGDMVPVFRFGHSPIQEAPIQVDLPRFPGAFVVPRVNFTVSTNLLHSGLQLLWKGQSGPGTGRLISTRDSSTGNITTREWASQSVVSKTNSELTNLPPIDALGVSFFNVFGKNEVLFQLQVGVFHND